MALTKKITAMDVANYVIYLASQKVIGDEGEVEGITNLKLQKILYFIEAYSLSVKNQSLFDDPIEAWVYGPVVPSVYHELKENSSNPIFITGTYNCELSKEITSLIENVWSTFDKFSTRRLVDITHGHSPWINAFEISKDGGSAEIDREVMKEYYSGLFSS